MVQNLNDQIDQGRFRPLMARFSLFENAPHIAVGVSGGADSMALAVLLSEWAASQGGWVTALIVDHGLRSNSGTEAASVFDTLKKLRIEAVILPWAPDGVSSGIQAKARTARYQLMENWCRNANVLHLAIAHHADDQAETVLMRLQKGSGADGLAGMPHARELMHCRIIRPLLDVRKKTLVSFLETRGIPWIEDPSNIDPKYARTTIREGIKLDGLDVDGIVQSASRYARVREAAEMTAAAWLARHADLRTSGYISLNCDALFAAPEDIQLRILSRVATVIGGKVYPPSITSVERLQEKLHSDSPATVSGALFQPEDGCLFAYREVRNLPKPQTIKTRSMLWDGRFKVSVDSTEKCPEIMAFNDFERTKDDDYVVPDWVSDLPWRARRTIPVIRLHNEILMPTPNEPKKATVSLQFAPKIPLAGMGFSIA